MSYEICLRVPQKVLIKLDELEAKYGLKKEDIILRAILKVITEDFI